MRLRLATGVNNASVELGPVERDKAGKVLKTGAHVVETVARISIVKQMGGIGVQELKGPSPDGEKKVPGPAAKRQVVRRDQRKLDSRAASEIMDATPATARQVRESGADGKMDDLRKSMGMPDTAAEWQLRSRNFGWHDLRGMVKTLGLKAKSRKESVDLIGEAIYGQGS
jgi:hypothetical protein